MKGAYAPAKSAKDLITSIKAPVTEFSATKSPSQTTKVEIPDISNGLLITNTL